ncbi:MAG: LacI family DNA-binding transcriptional regulator [Planctomycetes bacterium]|nr:LacI family DNA-binding transcriptional regulator [Planctomycetota bacterium]
MKQRKSVSQKQVAEAVGVTQALVSYVLNGKHDRVSPEVKEKIESKARELGYVIRQHPPSQNLAQSNLVGLLLRSGLSLGGYSHFFSYVLEKVQAELLNRKVFSSVLGTEESFEPDLFLPNFKSIGMDKLIILGEVSEKMIKRIKKHISNVVVISASYPNLCHSVNTNEEQAIDLLVSHLVDSGHKHMVWVGGQRSLKRFQHRFETFKKLVALKSDAYIRYEVVQSDESSYIDGEICARQVLEAHNLDTMPTAFVCHNGMMARGAINYLHKAGARVPEDISVVGLDMTDLPTLEHPFITTAYAGVDSICVKAVDLLLDSPQEDQMYINLSLPSRLEVRESSGPARSII